jgi:LmbE family N-acetylglucosaminyl deacetylase
MTDGRTSHSAYLPGDEVSAMRRAEALEATSRLGLSAEDVHFLDVHDGRLRQAHAEAILRVQALLERYRPEELYVPLRNDGVPDHEATYSVVLEAVRMTQQPCEICEYPVWAWNQWPWVPFRIDLTRDTLHEVTRLVRTRWGQEALRGCTTAIDVREVREAKRQVLTSYRSQTTVLRPGTAWPTLGDVSDGAFVDCFFQDYEVFRCSRPNADRLALTPLPMQALDAARCRSA